jgi:signal peptidase
MRTFVTAYLPKITYGAFIAVVVTTAFLFLGTQVPLLGYQVKVVKSGSMEPAIPVSSIVVIAPSEQYGVGDVVTFGTESTGRIPVTHRIVEVEGSGAARTYITKGDANEEADMTPVDPSAIIGSVRFSVPYLGYLIEFLRTPLGYALLVGVPAAIIILDEIADIVWEFHKVRARKRGGPVGYRQPSRQRRPRDRGVPGPQGGRGTHPPGPPQPPRTGAGSGPPQPRRREPARPGRFAPSHVALLESGAVSADRRFI